MPKRVRKTVEKDGILHSYRRVIKNGDSLLVSLPAEWVREHGVQRGDTLVLAANSIITLSTKPRKAEESE
jgi:antitoxin component of MazEF toxin-antitoxin module